MDGAQRPHGRNQGPHQEDDSSDWRGTRGGVGGAHCAHRPPRARLRGSVHKAVSPQHSMCPLRTSPGDGLGRFLQETTFPRTEVRSFWETPSGTFKELSRRQLNNPVLSVPRSDYKYSTFSKRAPRGRQTSCRGRPGTFCWQGPWSPLGREHLGVPD